MANRLLRWRWPPDRVAQQFFVELAWPTALQINLRPPSPDVRLYLRYLNLSPLWVEVERVDLEISVGNQELVSEPKFDRRRVGRQSAFPPILYGFHGWGGDHAYFPFLVDSGRAAAISDQIKNWSGSFDAQLRIQIHGQCQTGRFEGIDITMEIPFAATGLERPPSR
jgi:hypothetical protein